jgi:hypothetical protein
MRVSNRKLNVNSKRIRVVVSMRHKKREWERPGQIETKKLLNLAQPGCVRHRSFGGQDLVWSYQEISGK